MSLSHAPAYSMPLFDKYGDFSALRSVIMEFYDRVLDSDVIGHFFEDVDLARLIDHQTKFFESGTRKDAGGKIATEPDAAVCLRGIHDFWLSDSTVV